MRIVVAVWLLGALSASVSSPAAVWTGRWEIVADPYTAHGLAGMPDSICGASCTIRDTWRGVSIDRVSVFDLGLPEVMRPDSGNGDWKVTRSGDALTITGKPPAGALAASAGVTRYELSLQGELLRVQMTPAFGSAGGPTYALFYRKTYGQGAEQPRGAR